MTTNIRNIGPPILPVPTQDYSVGGSNLLNNSLQQFGGKVSNAVNQLLTVGAPESAVYAENFAAGSKNIVTYRVNLTGNITINPPIGGRDGDSVTLWLYAGQRSSRTVAINSDIVVPTTITGATPLTIALGKKAVYTIRYDGMLNGGQWELVSFQNGY